MAVSNVELRVDATQAVQALQQVNRASGQADTATQKLTQSVNGTAAAMTRTGRELHTAANGMQYFIDAAGRARKENGQFVTTAEAAAAGIERQGRAARNAGGGFSSLITTLGGVAAAYANLRVAQQAVQAGIQREESARRLQFLAKGYNEVTQAQLAAARAGQQFGLSTTESNQQFAQLYGRLRPLNVSIQDVEAAFIGFNTAAKVSGATSAESAGALLQLTQALGSGVLRGQELNSVLEQAPGLVVALTKELGAPISQIRKLAEDGKITSEVVIRALKRVATEGAGQLEAAMQGPSQQIKNLQNAFQDFQVEVVQAIMPAVIESVKALTKILESATQYVKDFGAGWQIISSAVSSALAPFEGLLGVLGQIDSRLRSIGQQPALNMLAGLLPGGVLSPLLSAPAGLGRGARQTAAGSGMYGRYSPGSAQVPFAPSRATTSPAVVDEKAKAKAARDAERAAKAAAEEQKRVAQVIRDRTAETQMTRIKSGLQDKIAAAEAIGDKQLVARLKGQERELDIQYRYAQALAQEKDIRAQQSIINDGNEKLVANQRDIERELAAIDQQRIKDGARLLADKQSELDLLKQTDPLKRDLLQIEQYLKSEEIAKLNLTQGQLDQLRKILTATAQIKNASSGLKSLYADIGMSLKSGIVDAIQGAIDGTKSLGDVASQVLRNIANKLLDVAINMALFGEMSGTGSGGGLLGGLFKPSPRAMGGSVRAGQPYLVGERGPELFMPGRSGGIAPTGSFGGGVNVVVNVDASGSSVQGDDQRANQLGRIVSVAVQQEIVKQKRPGGLLA